VSYRRKTKYSSFLYIWHCFAVWSEDDLLDTTSKKTQSHMAQSHLIWGRWTSVLPPRRRRYFLDNTGVQLWTQLRWRRLCHKEIERWDTMLTVPYKHYHGTILLAELRYSLGSRCALAISALGCKFRQSYASSSVTAFSLIELFANVCHSWAHLRGLSQISWTVCILLGWRLFP